MCCTIGTVSPLYSAICHSILYEKGCICFIQIKFISLIWAFEVKDETGHIEATKIMKAKWAGAHIDIPPLTISTVPTVFMAKQQCPWPWTENPSHLIRSVCEISIPLGNNMQDERTDNTITIYSPYIPNVASIISGEIAKFHPAYTVLRNKEHPIWSDPDIGFWKRDKKNINAKYITYSTDIYTKWRVYKWLFLIIKTTVYYSSLQHWHISHKKSSDLWFYYTHYK